MKTLTYKDQCDRLAQLEIAQEHTSFGRWFLDDGMISTWVILPENLLKPVNQLNLLQIDFSEVDNENKQVEKLNKIMKLEFIGQRGIKDLKRVFRYLNRNNKEGE